MTKLSYIALFIMAFLSGCAKPPDLESPCRQFGKFCSQYAINETTTS
jgi:type IV secretion system protein VirB7